jgi:predicted RNA-binding Zn-ribbon protein involved in translation (DUF1610 family)
MPIAVSCSSCQKKINAPDKFAGKIVKCPDCGARVAVSVAAFGPPPPPPVAPPPKPFDPLDVLGAAPAPPVAKPSLDAPREVRGSEVATTRYAASTGPFVCSSCGARTTGRRYKAGSVVIEVAAWVLPIAWPIAVYYSWYRRRDANRECTVCGGRDLVRG